MLNPLQQMLDQAKRREQEQSPRIGRQAAQSITNPGSQPPANPPQFKPPESLTSLVNRGAKKTQELVQNAPVSNFIQNTASGFLGGLQALTQPVSPAKATAATAVPTQPQPDLTAAYQQAGRGQRAAPQTVDVLPRGAQGSALDTITRQAQPDGSTRYRQGNNTATFQGQAQGGGTLSVLGGRTPEEQAAIDQRVAGINSQTQALRDQRLGRQNDNFRADLQRGRGQFTNVNPTRRAELLNQFDAGQSGRAAAQQQGALAEREVRAKEVGALAQLERAQNAGQQQQDYGNVFSKLSWAVFRTAKQHARP